MSKAGLSVFTKDDEPRISRTHYDGARQAIRLPERVRPAESPSDAERIAIRVRQAAITAVPSVVQPLNPIVFTGADADEVRRLAGELGSGTRRGRRPSSTSPGQAAQALPCSVGALIARSRTDGTIEESNP